MLISLLVLGAVAVDVETLTVDAAVDAAVDLDVDVDVAVTCCYWDVRYTCCRSCCRRHSPAYENKNSNTATPYGSGTRKTAVLPPIKESFNQSYARQGGA